ncbi:hypothetical protein [Pseudophaeobacter sp.]|uniref:hypothetical protein n=1 Tax=Pseudophaeobacter sp. TaxID=1971739 RepID=UPI0032996698
MVQHHVTGTFSRRLWFIYEWMTGSQLDPPDLGKVKYVSIHDEELHYTGFIAENSPRHKINATCPVHLISVRSSGGYLNCFSCLKLEN